MNKQGLEEEIQLKATHLDAKIWGPHYWFFMMTVALTYPDYPTETIKRKYYDFFMNLPLFLPNPEYGSKFSTMLDDYPISPYLGCKDSLVRWVIFMHNRYNAHRGELQISVDEAMQAYYEQYMPKPVYLYQSMKIRRYYLHVGFILGSLALIYYLWE